MENPNISDDEKAMFLTLLGWVRFPDDYTGRGLRGESNAGMWYLPYSGWTPLTLDETFKAVKAGIR